jgi:hypothetical protein
MDINVWVQIQIWTGGYPDSNLKCTIFMNFLVVFKSYVFMNFIYYSYFYMLVVGLILFTNLVRSMFGPEIYFRSGPQL